MIVALSAFTLRISDFLLLLLLVSNGVILVALAALEIPAGDNNTFGTSERRLLIDVCASDSFWIEKALSMI